MNIQQSNNNNNLTSPVDLLCDTSKPEAPTSSTWKFTMLSSSYHSRDFTYHSASLEASTAESTTQAFTHPATLPQHEFNERQEARMQNQLHYGNQLQYQSNSNYHSTSTNAPSSPQHIHSTTRPQTPDGTFLSKSPYSNVEQAGKEIIKKARQNLDARRKAKPMFVEQKTSRALATGALEVGQTLSSPSVTDLKRQLWSADEQLQSAPVVTKARHSVVTQPPIQFSEQNSIQTTESSASLSQRSYRSLSPSRVSSTLLNQSNDSIKSMPTMTTAPVKTGHESRGPLFQSKFYAAARAARLRDQKQQEQNRTQLASPLSSANADVSTPRQSRSHSERSRSLSRSFSLTNEAVSRQHRTGPTHEHFHLRSNSERSRSLSRSFPSTEESNPAISEPKHANFSSRQSSTPLRTSPLRARYLSRSFSSTNETAASTRTVDSKEQTNLNSHQSSPLPSPHQTSQNLLPRRKSDFTRVPSSHHTFTSPATSASPSKISEKEHRLNINAASDTSGQARGRLPNMALEKGLTTRNGRSRSPFVEERMRSFSQDRRQSSPLKPSHYQDLHQMSREEGKQTAITQPSKSSSVRVAVNNSKPRGASARGERTNITAFWNGRINQVTPSPKGPVESPQKQEIEHNEKETNSTESKPSSIDLMAKLQAVDRANPAQALAQIDFILREEGHKSSFEPILVNPFIGNDDDSAGTTISSLTNPDYRDWQHQQQMRASQQVPNQIAPTAISSFRRPRPSSLQNYSANNPPKEKPSTQIAKFQKQPQSIRTTPLERLKARQLPKLANATGEGRLENERNTDSQDNMTKDSAASPLPRPSPLPTRRSHPWDGDTPQTESISVSVAPKEEKAAAVDADARVAKEVQEVHARSTPQRRIPEVKKMTHPQSNAILDPGFNVNSTRGDVTVIQSKGIVSTPRITPQQYEHARKIADNFDAAWASMPETGFAPTENAKVRQGRGSQSSRSSRSLDLDASFDTSTNASRSYHSRSVSVPDDGDSDGVNGERFSIEVSYIPSSIPKKAAAKSKSRKRGFLRSLVRRQTGKKGTTSSTNSDSQHSAGMYSGSQSSSAAQSHSTHNSMPSGRSPSMVSPPYIRNDSRQRSPTNAPSNPNPTAPIPVSESIDKFRSASMAKKYSRVMRLYDDD